jgi:glutamate/tyrosine decarboxylase-like PLP-dependent enzyme
MKPSLELLSKKLEQPQTHPDAAELAQNLGQLSDWLLHHFRSLPDQAIGRKATRREMEAILGGPAPEIGKAFAQVLQEFAEKIAPFAFRVNHPRFLAFIPGAPNYISVLGEMLCAGTNFFAGVWMEAAGPSEVECQVLDWFRDFLGMAHETGGIITSGGSEANLTALTVAREPLSSADRSRAVLYVTEQRHRSIDRGAKIIGLLPNQIRQIPADEHFRISCSLLVQAIRSDRQAGRLPWAVVANAGATNTGVVDPLDELADLCRENRLWFHVDAAYGWSAVLVPEGKKALQGIDRADSVTLDPHKWFAQTFEAGCLLVRPGKLLADTFAMRPDYMQDVTPGEDEINFADYGLALTRRFRALKIWLSVQVLGLGWYRELVERCCRLADLGEALLERSGRFQILSRRQLSIVCFRYVPPGVLQTEAAEKNLDRLNEAIVEELLATGRAFLSSTRLQGKVALRFCFVNWRTTSRDVAEIVQLLEEIGQRLATRFLG